MSLKDQVVADVKVAMKAKDSQKLESLRFLHAAIKNKEIEVRPNELSDDDVMAVIKKLSKQHKDSIEQFEKAGRKDLAEKETAQLKVIETYLPEQMGRDQVEAAVVEAIKTLGADSMKQMGAVMKEVMAKTGGAADNKIISEITRQKLQ